MDLLRFIFFWFYNLAIRRFKEKDFPWFFASGILSMTFTTVIVLVLEIFELIMRPQQINIYGQYHGYLSLVILLSVSIYLRIGNKYFNLLSEVETYSLSKKKRLRIYMFSFYVFLVTSFFLIGFILRK